MKAGKLASLSLLAFLAVTIVLAGAIISWLPAADGRGPFAVILIGGVVTLACAAAAILPLGIALDRSLTRLCTSIETAASRGDRHAHVAPAWMRPITRAFTGAFDQFQQREQALRNQLRDLEIRHRVSEAERRHVRAVLDAINDAVLVTNAFSEIVMANHAAATLLGFDAEEALHQPLDRIVQDKQLCQFVSDARDSANFGDSRHVEHELKSSADGRTTLFDVTLACVENHKHEVGGVVAILHDLTRERELSQMKSDFVSKASHELRTPLSSIRAYVEMLVDGEATDEESRQEFYRIIQDEAERLGRLIDNMLNISRIEAGIIQIERETVDMKQVIERAMHTLEPQARDKEISLSTRLAAIDLCIEGDADMLYQVVLNLTSNAVKYTPEGGRITISADSDNLTRSLVVTVADTGLGIPPDALPKLFDKFFRVENYKRIAKGTGLGLSLCKHIVETVHHGQIGVDSKLGMGSKFWFSIPMRYAGSQAAA